VLANVAESQLPAAHDFARVQLFLIQEHSTEGRLARAVAADESHFLIIGQRAAGPVEQRLLAVAFVGIDEL
jgi:hypothetical protein